MDVVVEATGVLLTREKLQGHITAGAKKVLTTYYIGLYSAAGSMYNMLGGGQFHRYIPGFNEQATSGVGIGGWHGGMCDAFRAGR